MKDEERQIGPYILTAEIGRGAMGVVYRAQHKLTRREVALKVIFENVAQSFAGAERFRREVSVSALVDDPGIVEIFDAGEIDGKFFYAMELLEGDDLEDLMRTRSLDEVVATLADVAQTVAQCHEAGIIHRDLKPENIYLREEDGLLVTKVLDFGIASVQASPTATQTGFALGTPAYMSPEQAMAPKTAGGASDIWSIGVMLYEACTGRLPFRAEAPAAVLMQVVNEAHEPLPDDIPAALIAITERCLAKNPEDRYANADDLARDLRAYLSGSTVSALAAASASGQHDAIPTLLGTPTPVRTPALGAEDEEDEVEDDDDEVVAANPWTSRLMAVAAVVVLAGAAAYFALGGEPQDVAAPETAADQALAQPAEEPAEELGAEPAEEIDDGSNPIAGSKVAVSEAFDTVSGGVEQAAATVDEAEAPETAEGADSESAAEATARAEAAAQKRAIAAKKAEAARKAEAAQKLAAEEAAAEKAAAEKAAAEKAAAEKAAAEKAAAEKKAAEKKAAAKKAAEKKAAAEKAARTKPSDDTTEPSSDDTTKKKAEPEFFSF